MPSPIKKSCLAVLTSETFAFFLLLAASLQIMENMLPRIPIFPWLRLGLTYLVLLPFLLRYGALNTVWLFCCRNLITLVYGGQIFSSFLISSISGIFTLGIVGYISYHLYRKKWLGLIGVSTLLACSFNVVQLSVVNLFYIRHGDLFFQLPPLLIWSLISGTLIAFLVAKSHVGLELLFTDGMGKQLFNHEQSLKKLPEWYRLYITLIVLVFLALFLIQLIWLQVVILILLLLMTRFRYLRFLFYAWPFYFYLVWLHLFRTDGIYIFKDWITQEGLDNFTFYAIRTTNIIIYGQWLSRFILAFWQNTKGNLYLKGVGYVLPILPALFGLSFAMGKELFAQLRNRNFTHLLSPIIIRLKTELTHISQKV